MAENKEIKARVLLKHDTAANWDSASKNGFKPKVAEPIFYDDKNGLKVGDGVHTPNELPFTGPIAPGDGNASVVGGSADK